MHTQSLRLGLAPLVAMLLFALGLTAALLWQRARRLAHVQEHRHHHRHEPVDRDAGSDRERSPSHPTAPAAGDE